MSAGIPLHASRVKEGSSRYLRIAFWKSKNVGEMMFTAAQV